MPESVLRSDDAQLGQLSGEPTDLLHDRRCMVFVDVAVPKGNVHGTYVHIDLVRDEMCEKRSGGYIKRNP